MHARRAAADVALLLGLVALLAACATPPAEHGAQLDLRLQPAVGETYHLEMLADQVITLTVQGEAIRIPQTIGFGFTMTVTETDAQGSWIAIRYDWARVKQEALTGTFDYDSRNPPEVIPPAALGFGALIGKGFSTKVTPDGRVVEVTGADEMIAGMMRDLSIADEGLRAQLERDLRDQYGDESLRKTMEGFVVRYPAEPIEVGDSWTAQMKVGGFMPYILDTTYTLESTEGDRATIALTSAISANPDAPASDMDVAGATMRYEVTGTQQGTMTVDLRTGWSADAELSQSVTGTMIATTASGETSVPVAIEATTRLTMTKE